MFCLPFSKTCCIYRRGGRKVRPKEAKVFYLCVRSIFFIISEIFFFILLKHLKNEGCVKSGEPFTKLLAFTANPCYPKLNKSAFHFVISALHFWRMCCLCEIGSFLDMSRVKRRTFFSKFCFAAYQAARTHTDAVHTLHAPGVVSG